MSLISISFLAPSSFIIFSGHLRSFKIDCFSVYFFATCNITLDPPLTNLFNSPLLLLNEKGGELVKGLKAQSAVEVFQIVGRND